MEGNPLSPMSLNNGWVEFELRIFKEARIFLKLLKQVPAVVHLLSGLSVTFIDMKGARCSSVVRAFTHGAMGRIDPSWWTH